MRRGVLKHRAFRLASSVAREVVGGRLVWEKFPPKLLKGGDMPRNKASSQMQPLICLGDITAWNASVSLCGAQTRSMTFKVELSEPIKGRSSAVINVSEQQSAPQQPECLPLHDVGARIVSMTKENVCVSATVSSKVMTTLLTLAASNRLNSCLLSCNPPFRGQAVVTALHIGTDANMT